LVVGNNYFKFSVEDFSGPTAESGQDWAGNQPCYYFRGPELGFYPQFAGKLLLPRGFQLTDCN